MEIPRITHINLNFILFMSDRPTNYFRGYVMLTKYTQFSLHKKKKIKIKLKLLNLTTARVQQ